MKNNASTVYAFLLIVGDFLALLAAFVAAYILRVKLDPRPLIEQIPALPYVKAFMVVLPLWILVHAFIGLYNSEVYERRFSEIGRLFIGSFIGILVVIGYDFVTDRAIFPARLVPIYGLGLGFSFLLLFRSLARTARHLLYKFGIGISSVLVIGDTEASVDMVNLISDTKHSGQRVIGVVGRKVEGIAYFQSFEEAIKKLNESPHSIIQTELFKDSTKNGEILKYTQEHHVAYRFIPGNSNLFVGNIQVELFAGLPVIAVHQTALIGWGRIVKRIFDFVMSTILVVVLSPVLLILAILVKLSDPKSSIFFRQERLTRFNRKFTVYKFRSQYGKYDGTTPEAAFALMGRPELAKAYRENGDYLPEDPRVTPFGRLLRRTSLDELPQLFNVIKSDLSLVGPRALIPEELNIYEKKHHILSVKSGITGLAQVSGRRDISFEERRKLDMYYVQNWSFWLDLTILLKTLRTVLTASGAK